VSAYELYTAPFGSSADKVFGSLERHPYVAGGFVWSGWDYLGEPTPYYLSRSSYYGIIDLAGFKKDRFYLYQSRGRLVVDELNEASHAGARVRTA
jgi:beta-galactosidase